MAVWQAGEPFVYSTEVHNLTTSPSDISLSIAIEIKNTDTTNGCWIQWHSEVEGVVDMWLVPEDRMYLIKPPQDSLNLVDSESTVEVRGISRVEPDA